MNTLKSKLPKIEIKKNDYVKNSISKQTVEKKVKYLLNNVITFEQLYSMDDKLRLPAPQAQVTGQ